MLVGGCVSSEVVSSEIIAAARAVDTTYAASAAAFGAAGAAMAAFSVAEGSHEEGTVFRGARMGRHAQRRGIARVGGESDIEGRPNISAGADVVIELKINPPSYFMGNSAVRKPPAGLPCHSSLPLELVRYFAEQWSVQADVDLAGRVPQSRGLPLPGSDLGVEVAQLECVDVGSWPRM